MTGRLRAMNVEVSYSRKIGPVVMTNNIINYRFNRGVVGQLMDNDGVPVKVHAISKAKCRDMLKASVMENAPAVKSGKTALVIARGDCECSVYYSVKTLPRDTVKCKHDNTMIEYKIMTKEYLALMELRG